MAGPHDDGDSADAQHEVSELFTAFAPALVGVTAWRIDLRTNQMTLVAHAEVPEVAEQVEQLARGRWRKAVPAFGDDPTINHMLGLIYHGHFACVPPDPWPVLARFQIVAVCMIAVPPGPVGLTGMLAGRWRAPLTDDERARAEVAFRAAAEALVWTPRRRPD